MLYKISPDQFIENLYKSELPEELIRNTEHDINFNDPDAAKQILEGLMTDLSVPETPWEEDSERYKGYVLHALWECLEPAPQK